MSHPQLHRTHRFDEKLRSGPRRVGHALGLVFALSLILTPLAPATASQAPDQRE